MTAPVPTSPAKPSRRRALRWGLELGIGIGVFAAIGKLQTRSLLDAGEPAPDFSGRMLDGSEVRLSDRFGERIFLHFWAPWCGVCRQEFGMLNRLQEELPAGTRMLAVASDEEFEALSAFADSHALRYPICLAAPEVVRAYQVQAFPTNYFIDPSGRVASATVGMSSAWSVRARLRFAG